MDCSTPGFLVLHISRSLLKLMSIESVMSFKHLIFCHPLLLLPANFPSIKVFSNESALHIRWPKYWNFSFSISPSNEYSGLISFRIDWFDLLAVHGTLEPSPIPQFFITQSSLGSNSGPLHNECRTLANRATGKSQHQWTKRQRFWAWFADSKVVFAAIFILYFPLSPYFRQWLETFHPLNKYVLCTYWYK